MGHYRMITEWHADAPLDRVWDALLLVRDWPTWWKGFRSVEQLRPGEESGVAMVVRQAWRSYLPYTLEFDLEILRVERRTLLEGRASGDVEGTCRWSFEQRDGGTVVRFVMDVRTTRWWMNLPAPFAGRVFAFNYHAIMRWGSEGLGRLLATGVAYRRPQVLPAAA